MPPRSEKEDYMLIASGPSENAPFLGAWKDFKDNIRGIINNQPGWAEVMPGRGKGDMQAWCRLDDKEDAESAYNYYIQCQGVLGHLFKTSRVNGDYRLMKCNCTAHFPAIADRCHSPIRSGINVDTVNSYLGRTAPLLRPEHTYQVLPASSAYPYAGYPQAQVYATPSASSLYYAPMQLAAPQAPVYSTNTSGLPVNMGNGAYFTEARGIFISNLDFRTSPNDLIQLLNIAGHPVESKMHKDARTGLFKGAATAKFATKNEALYAVQTLNKIVFLGKRIHVRLDTDTTIVGEVQQPVIVNGSNLPRVSSSKCLISSVWD
ncbi:hypothetical protein K505DRAFT_239969 [Melanomma pulvis-pyrius CBS 109.77]|uniref:RRM domain-containing protein n=1 Tax=Melanomma pulvis-pyrius CBS 109.77 TaxID=1314802 RepID=A0A6A6XHM2_9PLEO|nr:hypothetical protein K505DRAFT_239969 [Melanomma pulvis-pyrius CBS 109.77]